MCEAKRGMKRGLLCNTGKRDIFNIEHSLYLAKSECRSISASSQNGARWSVAVQREDSVIAYPESERLGINKRRESLREGKATLKIGKKRSSNEETQAGLSRYY